MREVGEVSDRELFLLGVALYWAEGAKDKPWARSENASLINSDADLIRLYLRWLQLLGIPKEQLVCHLSIHESADVEEAERYWADVTGIDRERFNNPSLKRHNPRTVRHNTGTSYRGCLVVRVRRGAQLYRRIEGWWHGLVCGVLGPESLPPAYARDLQSPVGL